MAAYQYHAPPPPQPGQQQVVPLPPDARMHMGGGGDPMGMYSGPPPSKGQLMAMQQQQPAPPPSMGSQMYYRPEDMDMYYQHQQPPYPMVSVRHPDECRSRCVFVRTPVLSRWAQVTYSFTCPSKLCRRDSLQMQTTAGPQLQVQSMGHSSAQQLHHPQQGSGGGLAPSVHSAGAASNYPGANGMGHASSHYQHMVGF
jgi:hypothetical protein